MGPVLVDTRRGAAEHVLGQALAAGVVVGANPDREVHRETRVLPARHLPYERLVDLAAVQKQVLNSIGKGDALPFLSNRRVIGRIEGRIRLWQLRLDG
jgi:hypothetical protein